MDCLQNRLLYGALQGVSWGVLLVVGSAFRRPVRLGRGRPVVSPVARWHSRNVPGSSKEETDCPPAIVADDCRVPSCHDPEEAARVVPGCLLDFSIYFMFPRRAHSPPR
ncbi:hypothetical protein GWL_26430 [Herbaspirillum sp. GW103]|nr:hypothetical protein GWL_26430 [Herbaspirillum sp. GW103]